MFRFEYYIFLLTLLLVPIMVMLFLSLLKWKSKTIGKIGDPGLVKQLIQGYSPSRFRLKFIMIVVAFVVSALALANLQRADQVGVVARQGVDVMIALDVSKSMMAEDIQPNRLQRAKLMVSKLIEKLQNDRVGLVLFAGRAYLQMPLTSDHGAAKMYVSTASTSSVPTQGTVIGEALQICSDAFDQKQKKFKTVILISDGEDHDESAGEIARKMAEDGVLIHTVGVGTTTGSNLIDPETKELKRDEEGRAIVSRLNEKELVDLSVTGGGTYQLLVETDAAVSKILNEINGMETKTIKDSSQLNYRSYFPWFLALAIILLIVELFYPERKPRIS